MNTEGNELKGTQNTIDVAVAVETENHIVYSVSPMAKMRCRSEKITELIVSRLLSTCADMINMKVSMWRRVFSNVNRSKKRAI